MNVKFIRHIIVIFFIIQCISYSGENITMGIRKNSNGTYSIVNNNVELRYSPKVGGRIISFTLNGYEFIIQGDDQLSCGSTFWPSPQSMWMWPPLKALDSDEYLVNSKDTNFIMTSGIDSKTGLRFSKIIKTPSKPNSIELPFVITNESDNEIEVSPWQITRVPKGGIIFFPIGEGEQKTKYFEMAETKEIEKIVWYESKKDVTLNSNKLNIADGAEGWIAYAIDNRLLIKKFSDIHPNQFAPGEAEVLFYVSGEKDYIEIEVQGPYSKLTAGKSSEWTVEWLAYEIPSDINIEAGSNELVEFVRNKIK